MAGTLNAEKLVFVCLFVCKMYWPPSLSQQGLVFYITNMTLKNDNAGYNSNWGRKRSHCLDSHIKAKYCNPCFVLINQNWLDSEPKTNNEIMAMHDVCMNADIISFQLNHTIATGAKIVFGIWISQRVRCPNADKKWHFGEEARSTQNTSTWRHNSLQMNSPLSTNSFTSHWVWTTSAFHDITNVMSCLKLPEANEFLVSKNKTSGNWFAVQWIFAWICIL